MIRKSIIGIIGLLGCVSVQAESPAIAMSAGSFEVFESNNSLELGVEYRFATQETFFNIIPAIGLSGNSDGGYWAHAGGFIAGLVLTLPLWLRRGGFAFWRQTHGHPPHAAADYDLSQSRIPKVRRK